MDTLRLPDIRVWLGGYPARIGLLRNAAPRKLGAMDTNILFSVPPFFNLNPDAIKTLVASIDRADNFQFRVAILAPDGSLSPFFSETSKLEAGLDRAISLPIRRHRKISKWPGYEEAAFLALRHREGRHVLVDLRDPVNTFHSQAKNNFKTDQTFERLAAYDMTQIYQLVAPIVNSAGIPVGDASTEHPPDGIGTADYDVMQLQQMRDLSSAQDEESAERNPDTNPTGGRREETLNALFTDILNDAPGSYVAIVQAGANCVAGQIYPVNVTPKLKGVHIFGPNFIQVIPTARER